MMNISDGPVAAATADDHEKLRRLEQLDRESAFPGFAQEDFEVFESPEFEDRMPLLKTRITPKLKLAAPALIERMTETLGEPVFAHVALHLRRSVNPAQETWVAFARSARAYKPYVHIRAAISAEKVRVLVFVEDYADDKQLFAKNLARNANALARYCAHHPTIHAYDILDVNGEERYGRTVNSESLKSFADRLARVKGQHARFGIPFAKSHPVLASGPECLETVIEAARQLRPFYDCGKPGFVYKYSPESIVAP